MKKWDTKDVLDIFQTIAIVGTLIVAIYTLQTSITSTSSDYALRIEERLNGPKYDQLSSTIDSIVTTGKQNTQLLKTSTSTGKFTQLQIEDYLNNFEDIGLLVKNHTLDFNLAYEDFSGDVESAWCNNDIQMIIQKDRNTDYSATAKTDPYYANFQYLAIAFLQKDKETCQQVFQ